MIDRIVYPRCAQAPCHKRRYLLLDSITALDATLSLVLDL